MAAEQRYGARSAPGAELGFAAALAAAKRGESHGFDRLYRPLNERLHRFGRARHAADPEGHVNDVFLRAFSNLHTFDGNEVQFSAWLFTISRRLLIDEARKRDRRPAEVLEAPEHLPLRPAADNVEVAAAARIGTSELLASLECLTPDQRDVVLLRVVSDLTIETIGSVLGRRSGAVKALQRRAFQTLAQNLESASTHRGLVASSSGRGVDVA